MSQQFILRAADGRYLRTFGILGPVFGASQERAMRFDDRKHLDDLLSKHPALAECEIETVGSESRKRKRR